MNFKPNDKKPYVTVKWFKTLRVVGKYHMFKECNTVKPDVKLLFVVQGRHSPLRSRVFLEHTNVRSMVDIDRPMIAASSMFVAYLESTVRPII